MLTCIIFGTMSHIWITTFLFMNIINISFMYIDHVWECIMTLHYFFLIAVVWTITPYCCICYSCYMCKEHRKERNVCLAQHMERKIKGLFSLLRKNSILLRMPALLKMLSFLSYLGCNTLAHLIYPKYAFPHYILHVCLFWTYISALTPYLSISWSLSW